MGLPGRSGLNYEKGSGKQRKISLCFPLFILPAGNQYSASSTNLARSFARVSSLTPQSFR